MDQEKSSQSTDTITPELPPNKYNVLITRTFDAPREVVFRAWIDQEQTKKWWGPKYFTNPVCELDARPGGSILIHMRGPDGTIFPMRGIYREIVEPERLVYTNLVFEDEEGNPQLEVLTTLTFAERDGKTELTVREEVVRWTPEVEAALSMAEEGMNQSLDKLAGLLTER